MIEKHLNDQIKIFISPEEKSIVDLISSAIIKKTFGEKEQPKCNGHRAARSVNGKIDNENDLNAGLPLDIFTIEKLDVK